uniref:Nucleoside diphosphate kinase-like domain-containing protein n=1 Tax=Globisporangium ultimum (strain ATCC 200006 / CBS 805.95 / DAOM BR144) TaxID=431595 RepID=K3W8E2_GLOUD
MASTKPDKHVSRAAASPSDDVGSSSSSTHGAAVATQVSVLLVQVEALHEDAAIRDELHKLGFRVKHQALVHLSKEDAHAFVHQVCDPMTASARLHQSLSHSSNEDKRPTSTSEREELQRETGEGLPTPRFQHGDGENLEDVVCALASGPALMLAMNKPNAVKELQDLVGPWNPELWSSAPATLRARFGKNQHEVGVRCSGDASTVAQEIEFLLARSGGSGAAHRESHRSSASNTNKTRTADVDVDQLLAFLFPSHLQHPNSAGRLFVFGLYGPLDGNARLRSGEQGRHVVTDLELTTMSHRMEREDILSVYRMASLSQHHEEEVLRQVDQMLKGFPQYTPRDVMALFQSLKRSADGRLGFHDMQATIMKERCRHVLCMKERLHPALASAIQNQYHHTLTRIMKTKDEIAPTSFFLKDIGFTGAENATLVARLLSNHSFAICHLDDGNSPSLTQNVRLLRDQIRDPHDSREPWNPNCQHRK